MAQPMDGSLAREASHPDKRREARPQLDRSAARRHAALEDSERERDGCGSKVDGDCDKGEVGGTADARVKTRELAH